MLTSGTILRRARASGLVQVGLLCLVFVSPGWGSGKKPLPSKPTNEECLACHGDPTMTEDVGGKQVSISVNPDAFKASIHGAMFACVDCHTDVKTSPHETTPAKISCATCHADQRLLTIAATTRKPSRRAMARRRPAFPVTAVRTSCSLPAIRSHG